MQLIVRYSISQNKITVAQLREEDVCILVDTIGFDDWIYFFAELRPLPSDRPDTKIEWDIDANLPMYTRDAFKFYGEEEHFCSCHLTSEPCYGCEALNCEFYKSH